MRLELKRIVLLALVSCLGAPRVVRGDDVVTAAPASRAAPASDGAIHRALEFLKKAQQPDGAWVSGGFGPATSVTSLAVMAFLASGHVPGEPGPYRESIEKGIQYVLAHQHKNGLLVSQHL